eukprot:gb/GECH01003524.1/.p1 GENE.gb/GECH01003524.1/~~gb/GECH01003524.1/.p1  ORF type:complete len:144 (+),score=18.91 gb/GECH01003524.1/:1-432(+)
MNHISETGKREHLKHKIKQKGVNIHAARKGIGQLFAIDSNIDLQNLTINVNEPVCATFQEGLEQNGDVIDQNERIRLAALYAVQNFEIPEDHPLEFLNEIRHLLRKETPESLKKALEEVEFEQMAEDVSKICNHLGINEGESK